MWISVQVMLWRSQCDHNLPQSDKITYKIIRGHLNVKLMERWDAKSKVFLCNEAKSCAQNNQKMKQTDELRAFKDALLAWLFYLIIISAGIMFLSLSEAADGVNLHPSSWILLSSRMFPAIDRSSALTYRTLVAFVASTVNTLLNI